MDLSTVPSQLDAWSNLGSAYMRKGRLAEAAQCCRQVDAHNNLGNLMKAQGLVQEAYKCYLEALCIQPTFAISYSNLAGLFMESGDLSRVHQYYKVESTGQVGSGNLASVYDEQGNLDIATVNFNGETYESPNYCTTLRQAEHSAAEVALNALVSRVPSNSLAGRILVRFCGF